MAKVVWIIEKDTLFENQRYVFYFPAEIRIPESMKDSIFTRPWKNDEKSCEEAKEAYKEGTSVLPIWVRAHSDHYFDNLPLLRPENYFIKEHLVFEYRTGIIRPYTMTPEELYREFRDKWLVYDFEEAGAYGVADLGPEWHYCDEGSEEWPTDFLQYLLHGESRNPKLESLIYDNKSE